MSNIKFSAPFIKGLKQLNISVTAVNAVSPTLLIDKALPHERRVIVIVQNQSTTNYIYLLLDTGNSVGLIIPPLGNISFDNYNGLITAYASSASIAHVAYGTA